MTSSTFNKVIRTHLKPFLIESGFERVSDRYYVKTVGIFDYIIEIKSVGNYFSEVTGWPPQSIQSTGGVVCNVIKQANKKVYHFQKDNLCSLDQTSIKDRLNTWPEREREDIWWIDDDSNLEEIVNDLKDSIEKYSFGFFNSFKGKTIEDMIAETEKQNDGYWKYLHLYYLYKFVDKEKEAEENKGKFIAEGKKSRVKKENLLKMLGDGQQKNHSHSTSNFICFGENAARL